MTLKKIECPACSCIRRPVLKNINGYPVYVCPVCGESLEEEIVRAYDKPPRDKMIRAAKVNKKANGI